MHCSVSSCPVCAQLRAFKRLNGINYKRAKHAVLGPSARKAVSRPGSPVT